MYENHSECAQTGGPVPYGRQGRWVMIDEAFGVMCVWLVFMVTMATALGFTYAVGLWRF